MPSMSEQMQNIQKSQLTPGSPVQQGAPNPFQQQMPQAPPLPQLPQAPNPISGCPNLAFLAATRR